MSAAILTCALHLRKGQVNLGYNTCHIKASGVAEAAVVHSVEAGTQFLDKLDVVTPVAAVTMAISCRCRKSTESKQANENGDLETHIAVLGLGISMAGNRLNRGRVLENGEEL